MVLGPAEELVGKRDDKHRDFYFLGTNVVEENEPPTFKVEERGTRVAGVFPVIGINPFLKRLRPTPEKA